MIGGVVPVKALAASKTRLLGGERAAIEALSLAMMLDVLDALDISYKVMGGPGHCCGVLHFNAGDAEGAGRVALHTIDRFRAAGAPKVLTWCPSCQKEFGDVTLPAYRNAGGDEPFDMGMFVIYLAERLDALKPLLTERVEKRVGLHEHPGIPGVTEAAIKLLKAIPGLEFVDLEQPRIGGQCSDYARLPELRGDAHEQALESGLKTIAVMAGGLTGIYPPENEPLARRVMAQGVNYGFVSIQDSKTQRCDTLLWIERQLRMDKKRLLARSWHRYLPQINIA